MRMPPSKSLTNTSPTGTTIASAGTTKHELLTDLGWSGNCDTGCQEGRGHRCCGLQYQVLIFPGASRLTYKVARSLWSGIWFLQMTAIAALCRRRHVAQWRLRLWLSQSHDRLLICADGIWQNNKRPASCTIIYNIMIQ